RKALGGNFERGARASGRFEEEIEDAFAAQQRHLLHFALGHPDERFRGVQDLDENLARQALDGKQVLQLAFGIELRATLHGLAPAPARACRLPRASGASACPKALPGARRSTARRSAAR